jgi:hypothetical protein
LAELVPPALASLRAHLADGNPDAWRAGLRVLELAYGPAPPQQQEDVSLPEGVADVAALSWRELQIMAARVLELPAGETEIATTNVVPLVVTDNGTT